MQNSEDPDPVHGEVLFRLMGYPVHKGDLAIFRDDPDMFDAPIDRAGVVIDYVWDDDAMTHLVLFLVDGQILRLVRNHIRLP